MPYCYDSEKQQIIYEKKQPREKTYFIGKCLTCGTRFLTDASHIHYCSNKCYKKDNVYLGYKQVNVNGHIIQVLNDNINERVYYVFARSEAEAIAKLKDKINLFFENHLIYKIIKVEKEPQPYYKFKIYWEKD